KAIGLGLSIVFISHKLHEVMAISDRVVILRHGKVVHEGAINDTDRHDLAARMVGGAVTAPKAEPGTPGAPLLALRGVVTPDRGRAPGLKSLDFSRFSGQITGLAGVSGKGQAALAELVGGMIRPARGALALNGAEVLHWSPRAAVHAGIARIPEDRH